MSSSASKLVTGRINEGDMKRRNSDQDLVRVSQEFKGKFWHKCLQFLLFVHDYDLLAIYKTHQTKSNENRSGQLAACDTNATNNCVIPSSGQDCRDCRANQSSKRAVLDNNRGNRSIFRSRKVRLSTTGADTWRQKVHLIPVILIYSWLIRAPIIALAQYSLLKRQYLVTKGYAEPWLSVEWMQAIFHYLGNPFYYFKEMSIVLYLGPPTFCWLCFVLLPHKYTRHPINIASLRFILRPGVELKRIDMDTRHKVRDLKRSLDVYLSEKKCQLIDDTWQLGEYVSGPSSLAMRSSSSSLSIQAQSNHNKLINQIRLEQRFCAQIEHYLNELWHRIDKLRPEIYSSRYYRNVVAQMNLLVTGTLIIYSCSVSVFAIALELLIYKQHCDAFKAGKVKEFHMAATRKPALKVHQTAYLCNPVDIYTLAELLAFIERPIMMTFIWLGVTLNVYLIVVVSYNQVCLIRSMKRLLLECKNFVSRYEYTLDSTVPASSILKSSQTLEVPQSRTKSLAPPPPPHLIDALLQPQQVSSLKVSGPKKRDKKRLSNVETTMNNRSAFLSKQFQSDVEAQQISLLDDRFKLDKLLLQVLIQLMVCEQDLLDNSHTLAELTYVSFFSSGAIILLALVSAQFKSQDSYFLRYFTIGATCFNFNVITMISAHIYSRIVEIQRIMLLVLAENAAIFADNYWKSGEAQDGVRREDTVLYRGQRAHVNVRPCSFAADMWIRFVHNTGSNIERFCPRPVGIKLTFERIIELNFFIIFVYSLSVGRD